MSYYLIDFTTKNNDFVFDNIIIGRKIKIDQDNAKYYIYYQNDQSDTPKEIYIRLPILRLIYSLANHKYNQVSIPIYPNWDGTNKFIQFIKQFEQDIEECFNKKNIKNQWSSLINKKNMLSFIKANISPNLKITSNINNKNITLEDFKINGQIDMVIKISYIWLNSSKIGLSSQIYQIKYLAPPEQLDVNFIDPDDIIYPSKSILSNLTNQIPPPPPFFPNTTNIVLKSLNMAGTIPTPELPTQIKLKIIPSIKDLQKAIKDLRPVINKED
jgi:hypothetical protein